MKAMSALALLTLPSIAWAGPFGLEPGAPLNSLNVEGSAAGDARYIISVPSPLSDFESYIGTVTPQDGLCRVAALGRTFDNDANGAKARAAYANLKVALVSKYGRHSEYNFLRHGSRWKSEDEWAKSILEDDRSLNAYWGPDDESSLPPEINRIQLTTKALSPTQTYVNVVYEFANFDSCMSNIAANKARSL